MLLKKALQSAHGTPAKLCIQLQARPAKLTEAAGLPEAAASCPCCSNCQIPSSFHSWRWYLTNGSDLHQRFTAVIIPTTSPCFSS